MYIPGVVNVPEIVLLLSFSVRPSGSVPLLTASVMGLVPFVSMRAVYVLPTMPVCAPVIFIVGSVPSMESV